MKEKIQKYWKEIVIGILVLFSLNKCTQSCSRQTKLNKVNIEVDSLTQTTKTQQAIIEGLCKDTANYINQIRMYTDFDLKRDTQDSIHNADMAAQKAQTDKLIQQNRQLINSQNKK